MGGAKSKKRVFGQLNGKLNIPNNFNNEIKVINKMFYSKFKYTNIISDDGKFGFYECKLI